MNYKTAFGRWMRVGTMLLLICASGAPAAADGLPDGPYPRLQYSQTAVEPVIEYNLVHHMLAEPDPQPLLRIYGDGRVHVHYPVYMKRAGDYELQLSQPELRALIRALAGDGIIDFDRATAREKRRQLQAQQRAATGTLFEISDSSETVIEIRLDEYQQAPGTAAVRNLEKRFAWSDLPQDARRFPGWAEIVKANNAAQRLESLLNREDVVQTP
jgi:hypothetical protein